MENASYFQNGTAADKSEIESNLLFITYAWLLPVAFGVPGNLIALAVASKKGNRQLSACTYIAGMAVADTIVLLELAWSLGMVELFDMGLLPPELCLRLHIYILYSSSMLSGLYLSGMSVDRYLAVRYPLEATRLCTASRAKMAIILCSVPVIALNAHVLFIYYHIYDKELAEFDHVEEHICNCPPPCEAITFKPRFSYLRASDFDIDKILDNQTVSKLELKHVAARDTLRATDPEWNAQDDEILDNFIRYIDRLRTLLWKELPQQVEKQFADTKRIQVNMAGSFHALLDVYEFQRFVVRKNFYRFVEYNNEMYFTEVSTGYLEFFTHFVQRLRKLDSLSSQTGKKRERLSLVHALGDTLAAKLEVIKLSRQAFSLSTKCYTEGFIAFEEPYLYKNETMDATIAIIPLNRLRKGMEAAFLQFGSFNPRSGFNDSLTLLSGFYDMLNKTAWAAYRGRFNESDIVAKRKRYIELMGWYSGNMSVIMTDVFRQPLTTLEEYIVDMEDIHNKWIDGFTKIYAHLETILKMSNRTQEKYWPTISSVADAACRYRSDASDSKMDLARAFIRGRVKDAMQTVYEYLDDVFNLADDILTRWDWNYDQFLDKLMIGMIFSDEDIKPYARKYMPGILNMENFRKVREYGEIEEVREQRKVWANLSETIEDVQEPLADAFDAAVRDMQDYVKGNAIGEEFYKDNFISLVIYFEEMNYELIEQQEAYTIYSLLSDIGGSMGLFVGCSVISLFEILDAILYNQIYRQVKDKRKRKNTPKKQVLGEESGLKENGTEMATSHDC